MDIEEEEEEENGEEEWLEGELIRESNDKIRHFDSCGGRHINNVDNNAVHGDDGRKHATDDSVKRTAHYFVFSGDNKAGMHGYEKEKQAQIIYEMSKNSSFFQNAERQNENRMVRIDEAKKKVEDYLKAKNSNSSGLAPWSRSNQISSRVEALQREYEDHRDLYTIKAVVDMDMFFAAVAIRDRPHLKDKPVAIGGTSMISTSNYVARRFGVRSAMPGFIAKKLCPHLIFLDHETEKYKAASNIVKKIMLEYDKNLLSYSMDEFFLDLTLYVDDKVKNHFNNDKNKDGPIKDEKDVDKLLLRRKVASDVIAEIRQRVCTETGGLTCSAGIANNSFLAKIGADVNKPDGQFSLDPSRCAILDFLNDLPCRKVPGIGRVTENILNELGMKTVGDMRSHSEEVLVAFSGKTARFLIRVSLGIDSKEDGQCGTTSSKRSLESNNPSQGKESSPINRRQTQKSIGAERTFKSTSDKTLLLSKLFDLCHRVHREMKEKNVGGGTVTLKIKTTSFRLFTRSFTVNNSRGVQDAEEMFKIVSSILLSFLSSSESSSSDAGMPLSSSIERGQPPPVPPLHVRLIGVQVSKLHQLNGSIYNSRLCKLLAQPDSSEGVKKGRDEGDKTDFLDEISASGRGEERNAKSRKISSSARNESDKQAEECAEKKKTRSSVLDMLNDYKSNSQISEDKNGLPDNILRASSNTSSNVLDCPMCPFKCHDLGTLNFHLDHYCLQREEDDSCDKNHLKTASISSSKSFPTNSIKRFFKH